MQHFFPFGCPRPTAFYLLRGLSTFALHQALMHYVLAGSVYVTWATLFPGSGPTPRRQQPLAAALTDWMPFMLSAAITAGVAPLLFVQVLYPREFYTANSLLGWRWMVVIPVLVAAFYLLYLLKSPILDRWPKAARCSVACTVSACFLFVGFCWTANHLLANQPSAWPQVYVSGKLPFMAPEAVSRMLIWTGGAFVSLAWLGAWQLRMQPNLDEPEQQLEMRRLAVMAWSGLTLATFASITYAWQRPEVWEAVRQPMSLPYLLLAVIAMFVLGAAWNGLLRAPAHSRWLWIAGTGWLVALFCSCVLREAIRWTQLDPAALYPRHAAAAQIGGFGVFILVGAVAFGLIAFCIGLVRRELHAHQRDAGRGPVGN